MKFLINIFSLLCAYILILFIVYFTHITFFKIDVLFYSVFFDAFIASFITFILLKNTKLMNLLSYKEKIQIVIIWFLIGYCFAISIPTVIDRSLSIYILEKLNQRGGGIKLENFSEVFTEEYMKEHRLIDVRITEQKESGTIVIKNGCVILTNRGEWISNFTKLFRQYFLPKKRLLVDRYSDDLINLFDEDEPISNYVCN